MATLCVVHAKARADVDLEFRDAAFQDTMLTGTSEAQTSMGTSARVQAIVTLVANKSRSACGCDSGCAFACKTKQRWPISALAQAESAGYDELRHITESVMIEV